MIKHKNKYNFFVGIAAAVLIFIFSFNIANTAVSAADWREHWAKDTFEESIKLGILFPDVSGNIYPESPVTRGALCSYINKIMGFTSMADISRYTDTPASDEYYYDMATAVEMGYISPTSSNTLSPSGPVTRAQAIDIFAKVARINISPADMGILAQVRDSDEILNENRNTVASAIVNGFIAGRSGYMIYPKDYMTVCEAIVLLDRLNSGKRVYAFPGVFGPDAGVVVSNYSTIYSSGATLKNADVARDLEVHQDAGNGTARISESIIGNKLIINGGGIIYLDKNTISEIAVNKNGVKLIYDENQNNDAETLVINGNNVTVDINKGNKTKNIIINGVNATINVGENVRIEDLTVNGENAVINLAAGSRIETANLNAKTEINGEGSVGTLNVNQGGGGSSSEAKPDETNTAPGEDVSVGEKPPGGNNGGGNNANTAKKVTGLTFLSDFTVQVTTEDVGKVSITAGDFKISVDGTPVSFTVSKSGNTEFIAALPSAIPASSTVTVAGTGNLTGTVSASRDSQADITSALVTGIRTLNVTVSNPSNKAFSKDNFKFQIAGKDTDSFTVTTVSLTSYNINASTDIKAGQVLTVTGKNGLTGSVNVSAVSAIKSVVFNDTDKLTLNTDNTAGNTIAKDCFDIYINGSLASGFTVAQKSLTSYQITMTTPMKDGTVIKITGKKFLTGTLEDVFASPFKVSKAAVTGRTNISVALAAAPESMLSTEKHAGSFRVLVDDIAIPVKDLLRDPSDKTGKTYNLTVELAGTQGTLTVNGVKNSNNKGLVDYVPPELVSARMNDRAIASTTPSFRVEQSKAKLIIEFSEPVFKTAASAKFTNKDVALSGEAFNIIAGAGAGLDLSGVKVSVSSNSVVIDLAGAKRMDPGVYTLTINNAMIFDAGGNVCVKPGNNIFRFEIKGTLPTVSSSKQLANGDVEIKLAGTSADNFGNAMSFGGTVLISDPSKPVLDSIEVNHRFISYDTKSKSLTISRTALPPALDDPNNPAFLSGVVPYRMELYHTDYSRDAWQISPADENPLIISRVTIDTQRPKIETVAINGVILFDREKGVTQTPPKVSKANSVIQITFSKPVFEEPPSKKFTVVDTYGQAFNIDTANPLDPGNNLSLSGVKITTNGRTLSIPLRNAAVMNPGGYKIEIDPALIFDSVGNSADLSDFRDIPGFPKLICYFDVVTAPPNITAVSQNSSVDLTVRFTRYYPWVTNPYGIDMYNSGVVRILDLSKPEGQQQIGDDITAEFFAPWTEATYTMTIKRFGLPDNLTGGPYVLELDVPDYEKQRTPSFKIVTGINNDPDVTLGRNPLSPIPVNPNAEQTKISSEDAVVKIRFPISVSANIGGAVFTKDNLDVSGDISTYAFSVYVEDASGVLVRELDKNKIDLSRSANVVTIDISKAITTEMKYMKFTVAVNQTKIYDSRGAQIGNKISLFRFKLAEPSPAITSARQLDGSGNIQIVLSGSGLLDDPTNTYGFLIDGTNNNNNMTSTIQIERNGILMGYIPSLNNNNNNYIEYSFVGNVLTIKKAALDRLELDGLPVYLDGGEYTVVLTHSNFSDNRTPILNIDTAAPALKDFTASVSSGGTVYLSFTFNENASVVFGTLTVHNASLPDVTGVTLAEQGKTIQITFPLAAGNSPSDYTVKFTVSDNFSNKTDIVSSPVIPAQHSGGLEEKVNGFSGFYNSARKVTTAGLIADIAAATPEYDAGLSAPAVMLQSELTITAPAGAVSYRYAASKNPFAQNKPEFSASVVLNGNGAATLQTNVYFYAANNNGASISKAQADSSTLSMRASWVWTIFESKCYYIFEWTMGDGTKVYTYVQAFK